MNYHASDSERLALFPLRAVLFPYVSIPLHIFEERYKAMISRCIELGEPFGIVLTEPTGGSADSIAVHTTGTVVRIEDSELLEDGRYNIMVRGESRFVIESIYNDAPYLTAEVRPIWDNGEEPTDVQSVFDEARELFKAYLTLQGQANAVPNLQALQDPEFLSFAIPAVLPIALTEKQQLLADASAKARLQQSIEILKRELHALQAASAEEEESGVDAENKRTIARVDSSYAQDYFSRS